MADLQIYLLGAFRLLIDGQAVDERQWSRKKSKALIKILALQPGRQIQREQLIELLWPETEPDLAANNLHKAAHAARRALEPNLAAGQPSQFLHTQDSLFVLRSSGTTWIDASEFESTANDALRSGDLELLERARRLYAGELLEEDRYEDWASLRREQLRLLDQRVLDRLAEVYEKNGHIDRALETGQLLVTKSPTHEPGHRRLMRLYAGSGQRHLALNQFKICADALQRELDAAPEPATVELQQAIAGGLVAAPTPAELKHPPTRSVPIPRKRKRWIAVLAAACLAALLAASAVLFRGHFAAHEVESLAVLPFAASGPTEDAAILGDGLTENMINSLSGIKGVRVMARSTVYRFRDRTADPVAVGKQLHVDAVLTGGVTQRGQSFIVSVELVKVEDGSRIWGRQYTEPAASLSRLQDGLRADVVSSLNRTIASDQHRTISDPEAYRFYIEAKYFLNKRSQSAFQKAIEYFGKALDREPTYALAYSGLADAYGLLGFVSSPASEYFPKARAAAAKALEFDGSLAEAHTSLGMVHALYDWDWTGAEAEFRRAIALNPGYATAHHWYGVHLAAMSRFAEARAELAKALELDPLSPIINVNNGYPDLYQGRYTQAEDNYRKALELDPNFSVAHAELMTVEWLRGNQTESMRHGVLWLRSLGDTGLATAVESRFSQAGFVAAVRLWTATLESRSRQEDVSPVSMAALYLRTGDKDRAIEWLNRAFHERNAQVVYLAVDPQFAELRSDPRFSALLGLVGLKSPTLK